MEKNAFEQALYADLHEHAQSLLWGIAIHSKFYSILYPMIWFADKDGPDQTAWMHRLTLAIAVRICPKTRFRIAWPYKCKDYFKTENHLDKTN